MKSIIRNLAKFFKFNFYENAISRIETVSNSYDKSIRVSESVNDIFSKDKLILGKYYYIRECSFNELLPMYSIKSIKYYDYSSITSILLHESEKFINSELDNVSIDTYKTKNVKYINIIEFDEGFDHIRDLNSDFNYDNSKLKLFYSVIKHINHKKYEYSKKSKS